VQENVQDAAKKCPPPKKIAICKNSLDILLHNFVLDFNKCMKIVKNTDDISPCYWLATCNNRTLYFRFVISRQINRIS